MDRAARHVQCLLAVGLAASVGLVAIGCSPDATGLASPPPATSADGTAAIVIPDEVATPDRVELIDLAARAALGTSVPPSDGAASPQVNAADPADGAPVVDGPAAAVGSAIVLGDSLALSAEAEIEAALGRRGLLVVEIDARENRRIARGDVEPGVDAVARLVAAGSEADLWIVALGTNDVGAQATSETFVADVVEILALLPADAELLWVDTRVDERSQLAMTANVLLRQVAATDPRMHVVDWHRVAGETGILIDDGVHLTPAGRVRFADVIARAVTEHHTVDSLPGR